MKTAFHRGRLAVAFYPGLSGGAGNLAYSELVFREIIDVNLTSEFEVCCPYMVALPWLYGQAQSGVLHVYVVDALVAPATVSSSVEVLVEVAAAEDIQFACPVNWQVEPYCPSTAQSGESYTQVSCFDLGPKTRKPNYRLAVETTGEVVKSVRQLIKRNWNLATPFNVVGGTAQIQIFPYAQAPVTQLATSGGALSRDRIKADPIALWSFAYVFTYGSLRYTIRPPGELSFGGIPQRMNLQTRAQPGGSTLTAWYAGGGFDPTAYCTYNNYDIEGTAEITVPNWNGTIGRSNVSHMINTAAGLGMSEPSANCTNIVLGDSTAVQNYYVIASRSAGDDYGMGLFVGVPPVVSYTAT